MKHTHFSIPKPCLEDWEKMTPQEKGRFCSSCAKVVVDFRNREKDEIIDYLKRNQNVCGTFNPEQLNLINLKIPYSVVEQHRENSFKLFFLAFLVCMGTSMLSCSDKRQTLGEITVESPLDSCITDSNDQTELETSVRRTLLGDTLMSTDFETNGNIPDKKHLSPRDSQIIADIKLDGQTTGEVALIPSKASNTNKTGITSNDASVNEKLRDKDTIDFHE